MVTNYIVLSLGEANSAREGTSTGRASTKICRLPAFLAGRHYGESAESLKMAGDSEEGEAQARTAPSFSIGSTLRVKTVSWAIMRRLRQIIDFTVLMGLFWMPASPASAQKAPQDHPSVELPAELARVLRDYEKAWSERDPDGLAALFTEDGFVLSPQRSPVRGRPLRPRPS